MHSLQKSLNRFPCSSQPQQAAGYSFKNKSHDEVLRIIYQVLKQAGKDDLILIYYSGHGKLNAAGKLHLTTTDTNVDLLDPTSIPLETIRSYIDISPSNKFILILDSCFSGAAGKIFARGSIDDQLQLASGGRGTYVMNASTGIQIANEKEGDQYGLFTKHIIDGIKSGRAANEDGLVTMDTLYKHVHDQVLKESSQEPMKWDLNVRGELVIARSKTRREERAKQIKQMLIDKANVIPDHIFTYALEIIRKQANQLSKEERRYDNLLDQLYQKRLELNEFIHEWYMIERDRKPDEKKAEEPIAQPEPKKIVGYAKLEQDKPDIKDIELDSKSEQLQHNVKLFGKPAESGRWNLVIVGFTIQLCLGIVYQYGTIRSYLLTYFRSIGLSIGMWDMTFPFIVFLAIFAMTMPLAGNYIQKMGPKKVCRIGGVLAGIGWFLTSFVSSPSILVLFYSIIGGIGVGIAYGCPIATSAQWFPDKRGLAVGLTLSGFAFSAALISYANRFPGISIVDLLKISGVALIIITVLLSRYLSFPPAGWKPAGWTPPAPKPGAAAAVDFMRNEMSKTSTFKGLWLCYTIGALAGLTAIGIASPVGQEMLVNAGMTLDAAKSFIFYLILPFAIFNGLGRPLFGSWTDKLGPKNTALLTYVLILASCLLIYLTYSSPMAYWTYIIGFAVLWGCLGGWLAIAPTATASYFDMKDNAKNYGLVFTAYGAGAVIGGIVSAQAKDLLGAYQPFFLIVAALAVIGIVVASMLMKAPEKKAA